MAEARVPVLVLLVTLSSIFYTGPLSAAAAGDERAALLALKAGFVDSLGALADWTADGSPHCKWTGVRCTAAGLVAGLDLAGKNLSGKVTADVLYLPSLTVLNLSSNAFATTLPKSLAPLSNLQVLDVSENSFEGSFPSGLGTCADLAVVNASGNNFAGSLPADLANATNLETLDLRGSFFGGAIPAAYGRSLSKLKFLGLSGNNLTGEIPPELGELESLESLIIGYNSLEGPIPPELGGLANLQCLDLAVGGLTGAIPAELGKLPSLTALYLYKNALSGTIPPELGNVSTLVFLDLSDNALTGAIPDELARLAHLRLLNVMCNRLAGEVPSAVGEMPSLEVLELWNNSLTGQLPPSLGKSSPLQWVDVSSNALTGGVPLGICAGGALAKLIMFGNAFTGEIPPGLATSCATLVRVRAQNNRLTGKIPAGFGRLPALQRLELAGNDLSGEIPGDLAASTSLSFVDVSRNRLQGPLPSSLLTVPTMQSFLASDNLISGDLPGDQFQDCPALAALDLSNNRLAGEIPSSLASCQRLVKLSLRRNRLSGEIPRSLANMPALAILDLSNNSLTGSIPENFGTSPALETLNLSYNNLTGAVPANGVLRSINPDELAGNPGLCGGVLPPCLGNRDAGAAVADARGVQRGGGARQLKRMAVGWLAAMLAAAAAFTALVGARYAYRHWYAGNGGGGGGGDGGEWPWRLTAFQRVGFTSADVVACVKEANVVGMGATGVVYRAELPCARAVIAVKKLWRPANGGDVGAANEVTGDVLKEVALLGRLRHRNIVRLLGYVHNNATADAMMLYEFMPNGSLWEALHGHGGGSGSPEKKMVVLPDWVARYDVAAGVAQALAYLHHDCHPAVIHRDVKSSNILLDAAMEPRLADFGLSRSISGEISGDPAALSVTGVAGSYGYMAPEYGWTVKVDGRSDVYSYGVVLLELVTGRRAVEPEFGEGKDIVAWVREKIRGGNVEEELDQSVGGGCKHVREEMMLVLRIAVLCTARLPRDRPSMRDVITMLGEAKPRRKSGTSGGGKDGSGGGGGVAVGVGAAAAAVVVVVDKDRPVFSTTPDSDYA